MTFFGTLPLSMLQASDTVCVQSQSVYHKSLLQICVSMVYKFVLATLFSVLWYISVSFLGVVKMIVLKYLHFTSFSALFSHTTALMLLYCIYSMTNLLCYLKR